MLQREKCSIHYRQCQPSPGGWVIRTLFCPSVVSSPPPRCHPEHSAMDPPHYRSSTHFCIAHFTKTNSSIQQTNLVIYDDVLSSSSSGWKAFKHGSAMNHFIRPSSSSCISHSLHNPPFLEWSSSFVTAADFVRNPFS